MTRTRREGSGSQLLLVCSYDGNEFESYPEAELPAGPLLRVCCDGRGGVWVGGDGLSYGRNGEFHRVPLPGADPDERILALTVDDSGVAWGISPRILFKYEDGRMHRLNRDDLSLEWSPIFVAMVLCRELESHRAGWTIAAAAGDERVWVVDGREVFQLVEGSNPRLQLVVELESRFLALSILEDRERNLWIGSSGGGLIGLQTLPFSTLDTKIEGGNVSQIDANDDGIWFMYRNSQIRTDDGRPLLLPRELYEDGFGVFSAHGNRVWVGGDRFVWIHESGRWRSVPHELGEPIQAMAKTSKGTIYLRSRSALAELRGEKVMLIRRFPELTEGSEPAALHVAGAGHLWLTHGRDLYRYDPRDEPEFERIRLDGVLVSNSPRALYEDSQGNVWVATYGEGLVRVKDQSVTRYTVADGLPDNALGAVLTDDAGGLWINSNNGVFRARLEELDRFARGETQMVQCLRVHSGEGDGSSVYRDGQGRLWFPTISTVVVLDPERAGNNPVAPEVAIRAVTANARVFPPTATLSVAPGRGDLSIEYTGLSFVDPEHIAFQYRLDGRDDGWIEVGPKREAVYTNLPPGDYRFEVRAASAHGVWSEGRASLAIRLEPHFYQTGWFRFLVALSLVVALFTLHRWRIGSIDARNRALQAEIVERNRAERALEEQQILVEQLRESKRLESLGRLAGGIAHDFNNILTVLMAQAHSLKLQVPKDAHADLGEITKSTRRAADLTRQLLAFSSQQVLRPKTLDPARVVEGMASMLRRVIREDIRLEIVGKPRQGWVHADQGQIEQVVLNLVLNSRDAMPDGGVLEVRTTRERLDEEYARIHLGASVGSHMVITVSDTGIGIERHALPLVFEPFFSIKKSGRGTGLGLASVHGIVRQSGGHVTVVSEPNSGTTFQVKLPAVGPPDESDDLAIEDDVVDARSSGTILLCDDDDRIRTLVVQALEGAGYRVLSACDPLEAMGIARVERDLNLLITDVIMPGMNGRELAERIRDVRPGVPVLYTSGYAAESHQDLDDGEFLQKPYSPSELEARIRSVLESIRSN